MLPHLRSFVLKTDTHLITEIGGDISLASPVSAPKWLPTSHGWPIGPLPGALFSYGGAFLVGPRSVSVVPHMTGLPGAVWVWVRLYARDLKCTSTIATHGIHYIFSEARSVAPVGKLPLNLLYDRMRPDVPRAELPCLPKPRDSLGWGNAKKYLVSYLELKGSTPPIHTTLLVALGSFYSFLDHSYFVRGGLD